MYFCLYCLDSFFYHHNNGNKFHLSYKPRDCEFYSYLRYESCWVTLGESFAQPNSSYSVLLKRIGGIRSLNNFELFIKNNKGYKYITPQDKKFWERNTYKKLTTNGFLRVNLV